MSYVASISGVTANILSSTLQITDNINDRSSCSFILDSDSTLTTGEEVVITNSGTRIFGGTIDSITKQSLFKGSSTVRNNVTCIDFNQIADRRRVAKSFEDTTYFDIVNEFITEYLTDESITTGTIQIGSTIKKATFNRKTVAECMNYLKNSTKINWNIDYNKSLQTFYREDNTGVALTEADMLEINVVQTREEYRNRQYIKAGQDETDPITGELPTPKSDGVTKTFFSRYPFSKEPTVVVNGTTVSSSNVGINGLEQNKEWYWNKNDRALVHDSAETTLSATDTLSIDYTGLVKIVVQADNDVGQTDRATVEGGTGLYEEIEDIASIDNRQAALDYANGLLQKYANITEIINIRTQSFRQAGQIVNITHSNLGISGDYLIESVDIEEDNMQIYYNLRCLSGESLGSWVEFFRKLKKTSSDFLINEDEVLVILNTYNEQTEITSSTVIKQWDALYPANDLYPSNTLYPNTALQSEVTVSDQ